MGHIGLTPQSVHKMGGYVVQGRGEEKAARLLADAKALEAAGCYALVLEAIPADLAAEITRSLGIPTIGIGAGLGCDGQVLVSYDLLGMNPNFAPKFVKRYLDLAALVSDAVGRYRDEVKSAAFPGVEHSFSSEPAAAQAKAAATGLSPIAPLGQAVTPAQTAALVAPEERPMKLYSVPGRD